MEPSKEDLLRQIAELRAENDRLKSQIPTPAPSEPQKATAEVAGLTLEEYKRYGRQMIVPEFGALKGQKSLKNAKVLVVGAGGLGCPALLYLSAAGVGEIGIVDNDTVDVSNLHRQVLHTSNNVGMLKCDSAKLYINALNPHVKVNTHAYSLSNENAFATFEPYDLILDCTDAPAVRYLINDVAVILGKTIVSGSGLKTDGQWTILNYAGVGPCYRCFHPKPPAADSITSCQDGGVIGPAIGIIGLNMALEAIKVLTGHYTPQNFKPFMCAFYGYQQNQYRTFKMRGRQSTCAVCGDSPMVTRQAIESFEFDYHVFCGRSDPVQISDEFRVSVKEYADARAKSVTLDVRPKEQFDVAALPNSVNIPWGSNFLKLESLEDYISVPKDHPIHVVCRFGNDSQIAAKTIAEKFGYTNVKDVKGGLNKWSDEIDPLFPKY